jgi:flagellar biogenesis protein FliO
MPKQPTMLAVMILLTCGFLAHGSIAARGEAASRFRVAQADEEFEATEAPSVTLEGPETLERSEEPEVLPEVPPPPPDEESPVAEWWKDAQDSLDKAIDERRGQSDVAPGEPDGSAADRDSARGLGYNVAQGFVALCIVIALILFCTYLVKRFGARTPLLAGASLGTVLGKVYLTPKVSLHFVRVKDIVLVIGVTPTGISTVAQLNGSLFHDATAPQDARPNDRQMDFLSQLNAAGQSPARAAETEDDEIAELKGDLARLQKYLQETTRELGD